jgi:signal transduction histidine kinase
VAHPDRSINVETIGDLRGVFDRDRVHQAITNLLINAVHHGTGPIELRAYRDREAVITEIVNHGEPIAGDALRRLFDPFSRGDTADPRGGLGLGLYIVHQIAAAHGGTCEVSSSSAATRFAIRWPLTTACKAA